MGIKDLNINGTVYAKYQIIGDILFFKPIVNLDSESVELSEIMIYTIINTIEKNNCSQIAYLNI